MAMFQSSCFSGRTGDWCSCPLGLHVRHYCPFLEQLNELNIKKCILKKLQTYFLFLQSNLLDCGVASWICGLKILINHAMALV